MGGTIKYEDIVMAGSPEVPLKKEEEKRDEQDVVTQEVYENLLMEVDTDIDINSVILSQVNKEKITAFLTEMRNVDKLARYNLKPDNRLLFYGSTGTGKTFLGKALSNHLGYKMLYVDIASALSHGNVGENLTNIFRVGNEGGYIIFLDEVDSIAWSRDSDDHEGGVARRATNTLFQQMDQLNPDSAVVCATNMLHRLDPAFERRFEIVMEFLRPSVDIADTVEFFIKEPFYLDRTRHDSITENRSKLSFSEYEDIAYRLMKRAVLNDTSRITMDEVYIEVGRLMNIKVHFGTDRDDEYTTLAAQEIGKQRR